MELQRWVNSEKIKSLWDKQRNAPTEYLSTGGKYGVQRRLEQKANALGRGVVRMLGPHSSMYWVTIEPRPKEELSAKGVHWNAKQAWEGCRATAIRCIEKFKRKGSKFMFVTVEHSGETRMWGVGGQHRSPHSAFLFLAENDNFRDIRVEIKKWLEEETPCIPKHGMKGGRDTAAWYRVVPCDFLTIVAILLYLFKYWKPSYRIKWIQEMTNIGIDCTRFYVTDIVLAGYVATRIPCVNNPQNDLRWQPTKRLLNGQSMGCELGC